MGTPSNAAVAALLPFVNLRVPAIAACSHSDQGRPTIPCSGSTDILPKTLVDELTVMLIIFPLSL